MGGCGGVMTVFIEQWRPENAMQQAALAAIPAGADARESVAVITVTAGTGDAGQDWIGRRAVLTVSGATTGDLGPAALPAAFDAAREALDLREHQSIAMGSDPAPLTLFIEVLAQPPHLIIAGAGHIAVPLAQIAKINDFEVTVLDDRPQYAHTARFPTADRVVAGPFRPELQRLRGDRPRFDAHTYLVLVTRGHQHDVDCLLEVLDDPVAYIGMIGSQRRIRAVFELLEQEQGIPPEKFDGVYAPVGIDIGARTPAEIAVCIMAEIINLQRRGPAESLSDKIRRERQERRERAKPV